MARLLVKKVNYSRSLYESLLQISYKTLPCKKQHHARRSAEESPMALLKKYVSAEAAGYKNIVFHGYWP
jgi:hypothetical protein